MTTPGHSKIMSMGIAIQAVTNVQSTTNLPVDTRPTWSSAVRRPVKHFGVPAIEAEVQLGTEFQLGTRNARVDLLGSGEHSVLCYDAATDYQELLVRPTLDAAIAAAEAWVTGRL